MRRKAQKKLYFATIIVLVSYLIVQTLYLRRNDIEFFAEPTVQTEESLTIDEARFSENHEELEESDQYGKVTLEQRVQVTGNLFISLYYTNNPNDQEILKQHISPALLPQIIKESGNEPVVEVADISLKDLRRDGESFKLLYEFKQINSDKKEQNTRVTLTISEEKTDEWVVVNYEMAP